MNGMWNGGIRGFGTVPGQRVAAEVLTGAARAGHLPHAIMICGPAGCGKLPFALALARYVCCMNPTEDDSCGECISCRMADKMEHPDIHFVFPVIRKKEGSPSVSDDWLPQWRQRLKKGMYFSLADWCADMGDANKQPLIYAQESNEVQRKLSLKSAMGGYKVAVVWLPEKMNPECANKLLKLVEEPPVKTLFIFVSEEPDTVLPTLVSRTQRINLPPIEEAELAKYLISRFGLTDEDAQDIARLSEGSVLRALQNISLGDDERECFDNFTSLMRLAWKRDIRSLKEWSEKMAATGREKHKIFLRYAARMNRESFMANFRKPELNYMNRDEKTFAVRFAPFITENNVCGIENLLEEASRDIEQNVNAKMVFFDLAVRMIVLIKNG